MIRTSSGVTHLNDCTVATPIFHEGRLVAFAAAVAHHSDVGGRVAGSEAGDSISIFQEGIRVPPVQIYAEASRASTCSKCSTSIRACRITAKAT